MKKAIFLLVLFFLVKITSAVEVELQSKVDEVTIYHSGALVNRKTDVLLKQGVHELVFKNISSKILLNTLKFNNKDITILNTVLVKKLTNEEYKELLDKKEALENQLQLLELKYKEAGFIKEVPALEKMLTFYSDKTMDIKKNLREVEKKLAEAKVLEDTQLETEQSAILKILVSVEKEINSTINMQYIVGGIGWSPGYEITVKDMAAKTIELKYIAKVMSQTGENWDNIKINLSSSFPLESPAQLPKPAEPWTLSSYSDARNNYIPANDNYQEAQQQIAQLEGITYQQISIPSFIKLRTLNGKYAIKSNSTIFSFPILNSTLPCSFFYYAYPSVDPEAYLVAQVTKWDTIGLVDGIANITVKNNDIGKALIKFSEFSDTLTLTIGKDNSVYITRKEIANMVYNRESSTLKKGKNKVAFEYEIRNNNQYPVNFCLYDQVPISQTKSADVDIKQLSGGILNEQIGEVSWKLNLEPGKTIKKELVFEIEADSKFYEYKKSPAKQKMRSINAPSF